MNDKQPTASVDTAKLRRIVGAMTPGEWSVVDFNTYIAASWNDGRTTAGTVEACAGSTYSDANLAGIAYLRNNALALADRIDEQAARIKVLENACSKQNEEVCQTLGQVLGYPWFCDDQQNFPGATKQDGVCVGEHVAESIAASAAKRIDADAKRIADLTSERDEAVLRMCEASASQGQAEAELTRLRVPCNE